MEMKKWTMVRKAVALSLLLALVAMVMPGQAGSTQAKVIAIDAGWQNSAALMDDGSVWTWGTNMAGQLGDGTAVTRSVPVKVPISGVKAIKVGANYMLALKEDGTVWGWGYNDFGNLGDGTRIDRYAPVQVKGLTNVKALAAGCGQSLALKEDGTVSAWGRGSSGQLGAGNLNDNDTILPVQVPISL